MRRIEQQLRGELAERDQVIADLRAKLAAHESQAAGGVWVPVYVVLPNRVYEGLRERAAANGQPAAELASLWLWRAVREF